MGFSRYHCFHTQQMKLWGFLFYIIRLYIYTYILIRTCVIHNWQSFNISRRHIPVVYLQSYEWLQDVVDSYLLNKCANSSTVICNFYLIIQLFIWAKCLWFSAKHNKAQTVCIFDAMIYLLIIKRVAWSVMNYVYHCWYTNINRDKKLTKKRQR